MLSWFNLEILVIIYKYWSMIYDVTIMVIVEMQFDSLEGVDAFYKEFTQKRVKILEFSSVLVKQLLEVMT